MNITKRLNEAAPNPQIPQQAQELVNDLNQEEPDISDFHMGGGDIEQYEQTDYPVYNYKTLSLYLDFSYQSKQPLLIYGQPGLGKSDIVRSYCNDAAQDKHKIYKNWNKSTTEEKVSMLKNPEKYFVLIDVRTAQLEPSDFVGIPDISSGAPYLETKQPKWIYYMSLLNSDGILFLDELNQGSPQTLKALYEVVLDASAAGTSFSKDFVVIGAGNLGAEHGNEPLPQALTNRFTAGVLVADPKSWIEWAEANNLDKYIIAFVKSNPSDNFYAKPISPDDPFPTPRQMEKLSNALKLIYQRFAAAKKSGKSMPVSFDKVVGDAAASKCGVFWARKFMTFLKHIQSFDLENIMHNVKDLNKEQADKLHALVVFMTGKLKYVAKHIQNGKTTDPLANQVLMTIVYITANLKKEWCSILWTSIKKSIPITELKEVYQGITKMLSNPAIPADIVKQCKSVITTQLPEILKGE